MSCTHVTTGTPLRRARKRATTEENKAGVTSTTTSGWFQSLNAARTPNTTSITARLIRAGRRGTGCRFLVTRTPLIPSKRVDPV